MELIDGVQALPPELSNQIQQLVFTATPGLRTITPISGLRNNFSSWDTKTHPKRLLYPDTLSLLAVSKATRTEFIMSWYRSTFIIGNRGCLLRWMASMSLEQMYAVIEFHFSEAYSKEGLAYSLRDIWSDRRLEELTGKMKIVSAQELLQKLKELRAPGLEDA